MVGTTALMTLATYTSTAQIGGKVYRDYNFNGQQDASSPQSRETGVQGVVVTVSNATGAVLGQTTTLANGTYVIPSITGFVKVEFANFPDGYVSGPQGGQSGTSIQFVTAPKADVSLGILYPSDYCQPDPLLVTACYVSGNGLNPNGTAANGDVLVGFRYSSEGTSDMPPYHYANNAQIGTTFGVSYQKATRRLFMSAYIKRHVGLGELGAGGIYVVSGDSTTFSATPFLDIDKIGIETGFELTNEERELSGKAAEHSADAKAYAKVGKAGIGSISISEDGKVLWLTNLFDRKLYAIELDSDNDPATPPKDTDVKSFDVPEVKRANGVSRPWAVKFHRGKVYVGVTYTGENGGTVNDLQANVFTLNPANSAWSNSLLTIPLNYQKGCARKTDQGCSWNVWEDEYKQSWEVTDPAPSDGSYPYITVARPMPALVEIEFDGEESMILGFRDRFSDQTGHRNSRTDGSHPPHGITNIAGGDLLKAVWSNGAYVLETNGKAGEDETAGKDNKQGIGGGEFFFDDRYLEPEHSETSFGGVAIIPGATEAVVSAMNPFNYDSGGMYWFNTKQGNAFRKYELYQGGSDNPETLGKANGLGSVEVMCDVPQIEIGNRVWNDANRNGMQDAGEAGIGGLTVQLCFSGEEIAETTTESDGSYYFNVSNVFGGIKARTDYEIKISTDQTPLKGLKIVKANQGSNDATDNDATVINGQAKISLRTGNDGQNDHTFDFGFCPCESPKATIAGPNSVCVGGSISLTVSGGQMYLWSTGSIEATTFVQSGGTYNVTITDADGCVGSINKTITETQFSASAAGGTFCEGGKISLQASTGTAYEWKGPEVFSASEQNPTIPNSTTLMQGVYSVTVTNTQSCTASATASVTVKEAPVLTQNTEVCQGGSASLSANGEANAQYLWNTQEQTPSINVASGGDYSVKIKDTNGCASEVVFTVNIIEVKFTPVAEKVTCNGSEANIDGRLLVKDFSNNLKIDYSLGNTYKGAKTFGTALDVAASGEVVKNLSNPAGNQPYTIRVWGSEQCFVDKVVFLPKTDCGCPSPKCIQFSVMKVN